MAFKDAFQLEDDEENSFLIKPAYFGTGRIHIMAGSPFAGKSTIIGHLIQSLLDPSKNIFQGLEFCQLAPTDIGMIFADRLSKDNKGWLNKLGVDIPIYSFINDKEFIDIISRGRLTKDPLPGYTKFLHCMEKMPPTVKVVFIDVFTNVFLGDKIHDQGLIYAHMGAILNYCERTGRTIIGTAYGSKQKGKQDRYLRLVDRIVGATSLRGSASDLMYFSTKEEVEQNYQILEWTSRHAPTMKFGLERTPDGLFEHTVVLNSDYTPPEGNTDLNLTESQEKFYLSIPFNKELTKKELKELGKEFVDRSSAYRIIDLFVTMNLLDILEKGNYIRRNAS